MTFTETIIRFFVVAVVHSLPVMGYVNRIPNVINEEKGKEGTSNKSKVRSRVRWTVRASKRSRGGNASLERQPCQTPWNLSMLPYMVQDEKMLRILGGESYPVLLRWALNAIQV